MIKVRIKVHSVSILLGQWITLEGGGMPTMLYAIVVSILLGQWITLEGWKVKLRSLRSYRFNPSGSMDYFGS